MHILPPPEQIMGTVRDDYSGMKKYSNAHVWLIWQVMYLELYVTYITTFLR